MSSTTELWKLFSLVSQRICIVIRHHMLSLALAATFSFLKKKSNLFFKKKVKRIVLFLQQMTAYAKLIYV